MSKDKRKDNEVKQAVVIPPAISNTDNAAETNHDYDKHIVAVRRICLALIVLGITAFCLAEMQHKSNETFELFNQFELILKTQDQLSDRQWNEGEEISLINLKEIDKDLSDRLRLIEKCLTDKKQECKEEDFQKLVLRGLTISVLQQKPLRVHWLNLTGVRSEYGQNCSAVVFRGNKNDFYWIWVINSEANHELIEGTSIYYVRTSNCRFTSLIKNNALEFILVDLRSSTGGWNLYAHENIMKGLYNGDVNYKLHIEQFTNALDSLKTQSQPYKFNVDRFFDQLPSEYKKHFTEKIPPRILTTPVNGIESRIIGEAYIKTGIVYNKNEIEEAKKHVFKQENIAPTIAGFETNSGIWTTFAPYLLLYFSFFFLYHVKRFIHAQFSPNESWLFLDAKGKIEHIFVILWMLLLILTPVSISWLYALGNNIPLEPIQTLLSFNSTLREFVEEENYYGHDLLSIEVYIGFAIIIVSWLFIFRSLYLILKVQSSAFYRKLTYIKSLAGKQTKKL